MSPDYRSGDIIFVRQEPEVDGIAWGRAYIVITQNERVLKCVYKSTHDGESVRLVSLNEDVNRHGDRLFPDREIKKNNIISIYRVEGVFRRERM
jgi:phage repressor protein C with HTH and peptisase S24 domain